MNEIFVAIAAALGGVGGIGSSIVSAVLASIFKSHREENRALKKEVDEHKQQLDYLKTQQLATLEITLKAEIREVKDDLRKHVDSDKTPEMLNELKHISAAVNRMANQNAQQLENDKKQDVTLARIVAKQENTELFLNNLNDLVVKHISPDASGNRKLLK